MKAWAVRLDVVCESQEEAEAYAKRLHTFLATKTLPLPKSYVVAEIQVGTATYDPDGIPVQAAHDVVIVSGGEDA